MPPRPDHVAPLERLLQAAAPLAVTGPVEGAVRGIEFDSRRCGPGSLFVAVPGAHADGHAFVPAAVEAGATVVVGERPAADVEHGAATYVQVARARRALGLLSHAFHGDPSAELTVVGVTGTNGKTTTTFLLRDLFAAMGMSAGIIGTEGGILGTDIVAEERTTPEAPEVCALLARMRDAGLKAAIVEASSQGLAQDRLTGMRWAGAVFTNLSREHLEFHADLDDYGGAKKILFDDLAPEAVAVVNGDDPWGGALLRDCRAGLQLRFGRGPTADTRLVDEVFDIEGTRVTLELAGAWPEDKRGRLELETRLLGGLNVDNAMAAVSLCRALGAEPEALRRGMADVTPVPGRMQPVRLANGALAVLDAAHSAYGLEQALHACRRIRTAPDSRLLCVFACMADRDRRDRPAMARVASQLADRVIVTALDPDQDEDQRQIFDDLLPGIPATRLPDTRLIAERREAVELALEMTEPGDVLLLAAHDVGRSWAHAGGETDLTRFVDEWNARRAAAGRAAAR